MESSAYLLDTNTAVTGSYRVQAPLNKGYKGSTSIPTRYILIYDEVYNR